LVGAVNLCFTNELIRAPTKVSHGGLLRSHRRLGILSIDHAT